MRSDRSRSAAPCPAGCRRAALVVALVVALAPAAAAADPTARDHGGWLRAAIAAAPAGSVLDVPAGRHQGPFVLERRLHLRGPREAVLEGDGAGHVVTVRGADAIVEGLTVRGSGMNLAKDHAAVHVSAARVVVRGLHVLDSLHGIYVRQTADVRIEDNVIVGRATTLEMVDPETLRPTPGAGELCEVTLSQDRRGNGIHAWNSTGLVIARNQIRGTRDGIYFSFVDDSTVERNDIAETRYGLHYMYSDRNRFTDNRFRDNAAGAALMFSKGIVLTGNRFEANRSHRAYGMLWQSVDDSEARGNHLVGNTVGLFIEGGHGNRVLDNRIAANHIGLRISASSDGGTFAGNVFEGNLHTVETSGRDGNRWTLDGRGNYWDGAVRLDLDGDGIGDLPHHELDLFGGLRRSFPSVGLLAGSPAERLLRFVHARLRLPGLAGITDTAPLVEARRP